MGSSARYVELALLKMGGVDRLPVVSRRIHSGLREFAMDQEYRMFESEFNRVLSDEKPL